MLLEKFENTYTLDTTALMNLIINFAWGNMQRANDGDNKTAAKMYKDVAKRLKNQKEYDIDKTGAIFGEAIMPFASAFIDHMVDTGVITPNEKEDTENAKD